MLFVSQERDRIKAELQKQVWSGQGLRPHMPVQHLEAGLWVHSSRHSNRAPECVTQSRSSHFAGAAEPNKQEGKERG